VTDAPDRDNGGGGRTLRIELIAVVNAAGRVKPDELYAALFEQIRTDLIT
jgi:hypothetical protein